MAHALHARLVAVASLGFIAAAAPGGSPDPMEIIKPSTTGVPGAEVRLMRFDPQGNLWIGARWPFWGEAALAMLPAEELPYTPLPGGGFDTGKWTVYSSVHHPIPSPYLSDLEFAADGTIWLASEGGLTRFRPDAETPAEMWHTYNAANSPLILNSVRSIDIDSEGHIWLTNVVVTMSLGAVFEFDPVNETWTEYSVGEELPWSPPWYNVNGILVSDDDHVWVTHSTLGGLAEFDGNQWVLHNASVQLGGMLEDHQGNIWITTSSAGLWKWNRTTFTSFNLGSQGTVTALGIDHATGLVYASAWYGNIYKMVNGTTPQLFVNAQDIPGTVLVQSNGDVWINNYGGNGILGTVRHYSAAGQLLERFNTYNSGLPDYFIDNIQLAADGHLWFACGEGGISRFDGERWRNFGNHNDQSEPYPWAGNEPMGAFYLDSSGMGWMGGNGIGRWDPEVEDFTGFWNWLNNPGMGVTMFTHFAEDMNGKIFVMSQYGAVMSFNGTQWVSEPVTPGGYTSNAAGVAADSTGNVFAAEPFTIHQWDGKAWSAVPMPNPNYLFDLGGVSAFAIGPDDVKWIGTNEGLVRWDGTNNPGAWTLYDESNSPMPASRVTGLDVRSDGAIGLASHTFGSVTPFPNGVVVIEGDIDNADNWTIYQYGSSPLTHYQLGDVEFDANGDLWVSAISEGVVKVLSGPTLLPGDLTGDGVVDEQDRAVFCAAIGSALGEPDYIAAADLNGDDVIDQVDQQMFNDLLPPCGGDIVSSDTFTLPSDGVTDAADLAFLLGAWASGPSCADFVDSKTFAPPPDGAVDGADLAYLLGAWGACR